jgi:hypothetical protein
MNVAPYFPISMGGDEPKFGRSLAPTCKTTSCGTDMKSFILYKAN